MSNYKLFWKRFIIGLFLSILGIGIVGGSIVYFFARRQAATVHSRQLHVLCCVAGRTGGHIIPALTLAQEFTRKYPGARVIFFSTNRQLDHLLIKKSTLVSRHESLDLENIPRSHWWEWPRYCLDLFAVAWQVFRVLVQERPERIISTGGYIAAPVVMVAQLLGIPVTLYNLDVMPGSAIAFLSKFADETVICFDETKALLPESANVIRGSYPVRYGEADKLSRREALAKLGIEGDRAVLLVFGGSQGSRFVNDLIPSLLKNLALPRRVYVLHQTGAGEVERVRQLYFKAGIEANVFAFREDMNILFSAADVVISRAGAGSLFELAFFNKLSLIIPLETVITDHQKDNAFALAKRYPSLFSVFLQGDLEKDSRSFGSKLIGILNK